MTWQHPIVLGPSIWSLWISELTVDQKEMISCSPGFALRRVLRSSLAGYPPALPPPTPSVSPCRCFSLKFLGASLPHDEELALSAAVSGNARHQRTGLQENNKQSSLKILQESFSEDTVQGGKCSVKKLMPNSQNEGMLFTCMGGLISLEIFGFFILAFTATLHPNTDYTETHFFFQIKWPEDNLNFLLLLSFKFIFFIYFLI